MVWFSTQAAAQKYINGMKADYAQQVLNAENELKYLMVSLMNAFNALRAHQIKYQKAPKTLTLKMERANLRLAKLGVENAIKKAKSTAKKATNNLVKFTMAIPAYNKTKKMWSAPTVATETDKKTATAALETKIAAITAAATIPISVVGERYFKTQASAQKYITRMVKTYENATSNAHTKEAAQTKIITMSTTELDTLKGDIDRPGTLKAWYAKAQMWFESKKISDARRQRIMVLTGGVIAAAKNRVTYRKQGADYAQSLDAWKTATITYHTPTGMWVATPGAAATAEEAAAITRAAAKAQALSIEIEAKLKALTQAQRDYLFKYNETLETVYNTAYEMKRHPELYESAAIAELKAVFPDAF